jgi:hypothetical protein
MHQGLTFELPGFFVQRGHVHNIGSERLALSLDRLLPLFRLRAKLRGTRRTFLRQCQVTASRCLLDLIVNRRAQGARVADLLLGQDNVVTAAPKSNL